MNDQGARNDTSAPRFARSTQPALPWAYHDDRRAPASTDRHCRQHTTLGLAYCSCLAETLLDGVGARTGVRAEEARPETRLFIVPSGGVGDARYRPSFPSGSTSRHHWLLITTAPAA